MVTVLKLIHDNTGGQPSLCKRVFTKSHWTPQVIKMAQQLNIQLLQVPKGMTSELQPRRDNIIFYKSKMNSHWICNSYNLNPKDFHQNRRGNDKYYDDLSSDLIKNSFSCLKLNGYSNI